MRVLVGNPEPSVARCGPLMCLCKDDDTFSGFTQTEGDSYARWVTYHIESTVQLIENCEDKNRINVKISSFCTIMPHVTAIRAFIRQDLYINVSMTVNIVDKRGFSPYKCHNTSVHTVLDNITVCCLC